MSVGIVLEAGVPPHAAGYVAALQLIFSELVANSIVSGARDAAFGCCGLDQAVEEIVAVRGCIPIAIRGGDAIADGVVLI